MPCPFSPHQVAHRKVAPVLSTSELPCSSSTPTRRGPRGPHFPEGAAELAEVKQWPGGHPVGFTASSRVPKPGVLINMIKPPLPFVPALFLLLCPPLSPLPSPALSSVLSSSALSCPAFLPLHSPPLPCPILPALPFSPLPLLPCPPLPCPALLCPFLPALPGSPLPFPAPSSLPSPPLPYTLLPCPPLPSPPLLSPARLSTLLLLQAGSPETRALVCPDW